MYTLRSVSKADRKSTSNVSLGDAYHLVCQGAKEYDFLLKSEFDYLSDEHLNDRKNPLIVARNGTFVGYLDDGYEYYIMTESGKTFENLSGFVK